MFYPELDYRLESDDPSLTIETGRLVAKVIDNNGLRRLDAKPYFGKPVFGTFTHHFGYHGIRTLYDKAERRNVVAPFVSILNWQNVRIDDVELDPVDDRAAYGVPRGWPLVLRQFDGEVSLRLDPMPLGEFAYRLTIRPAADESPDALDFSVRFLFGKKSANGRFSASWACYLAGWDTVAMHYPAHAAQPAGVRGDSHELSRLVWKTIGDPPDMVIGEPVGYVHDQAAFAPDDVALPLAYVRIGERVFVLMFGDPAVRPFLVNSGGHLFCSPVQNPALDFLWEIAEPPTDASVGFDGRLVYTVYAGDDDILRRYEAFVGGAS